MDFKESHCNSSKPVSKGPTTCLDYRSSSKEESFISSPNSQDLEHLPVIELVQSPTNDSVWCLFHPPKREKAKHMSRPPSCPPDPELEPYKFTSPYFLLHPLLPHPKPWPHYDRSHLKHWRMPLFLFCSTWHPLCQRSAEIPFPVKFSDTSSRYNDSASFSSLDSAHFECS